MAALPSGPAAGPAPRAGLSADFEGSDTSPRYGAEPQAVQAALKARADAWLAQQQIEQVILSRLEQLGASSLGTQTRVEQLGTLMNEVRSNQVGKDAFAELRQDLAALRQDLAGLPARLLGGERSSPAIRTDALWPPPGKKGRQESPTRAAMARREANCQTPLAHMAGVCCGMEGPSDRSAIAVQLPKEAKHQEPGRPAWLQEPGAIPETSPPASQRSTASQNRQQRAKEWMKKNARRDPSKEGPVAPAAPAGTMSFAAKTSPPTGCKAAVTSKYFDFFVTFLIVSNTIVSAYQIEYMAVNTLGESPVVFDILNIVYTMVFAIELGVRMLVHGWAFFRPGPDQGWNQLDMLIVGVSLAELLMQLTQAFVQGKGSQAWRVLRVLRVVRVVRALRVLRFFRELRMMVESIVTCVKSLFWAMALLFLILFTVATYMTQVSTDYRAKHEADEDNELAATLLELYGTLPDTIYNLFLAVSGGADWGDVAAPLKELGWTYALIFMIFVCFTLFAVLNIITGVFVEGALERAAVDKEAMIANDMEERKNQTNVLEEVFKEIDADGSGILELSEFETLMQDPRVIAWFRIMGLEVEQATTLFKLLDLDNSCTVSSEEFVQGCFRLQGGAKSVDVATLMYENKRMMMKWTAFMDYVEEMFEEMKNVVSGVRGESKEVGAADAKPSRGGRWSEEGGTGLAQVNEVETPKPASAESLARRSSWHDQGRGSSLNLY